MHDTRHTRTGTWAPRPTPTDRALRIGIGGPVGSGKTALVEYLCRQLRDERELAVVTNDIFTDEDAQILIRAAALPEGRVVGVETGGCPHTAIREDASMNLDAIDRLEERFAGLELVLVESGGDNLAAAFSPELADRFIYVIDVAQGEEIPRKGGPGITRSDLLVINKIDLAPHVGVDVEVMRRDATASRDGRAIVACSVRHDQHAAEVAAWVRAQLDPASYDALPGTGADAHAHSHAHAARDGEAHAHTHG